MTKIKLKIKTVEDARWLLNCAMAAIEQSYEPDSTRFHEMELLHIKLMKQIEQQDPNSDFYEKPIR